MPETQNTAKAIAITTEVPRAELLPAAASIFGRIGKWASETAQEFAALVSALMGPAVFSGYALAFWSLTSNLGWTDTFLFSTGPLSNWLVWLAMAVAVHAAAIVLNRSVQPAEK